MAPVSLYPTRRAVLVMASGVPLALGVGLVNVNWWLLGVAWLVFVLGLMAADVLLSAWGSELRLGMQIPPTLGMGTQGQASFVATFARKAPAAMAFALNSNDFIEVVAPFADATPADGAGTVRFTLGSVRRGAGRLHNLWIRWPGPMGLMWKHYVARLDADLPVVPNIADVKRKALSLFQHNAFFGANVQRDIGDGGDFHALRDFRAGMDRRTIDWKQSARHTALLAKEFHTERNQQIIVVLDTGHLMCEPVAGQPRLDRALQAGLLLAYAALKLGDWVGLFTFDAKPRLFSRPLSGVRSFAYLQRLASRIDYANEEPNYTLALADLGGRLNRRSVIVIFTEFADTTSAELMIESIERLLRRHVVIFVVLRDQELEAMLDKEPREAADLSRSVIADSLLRERDAVTARLRRLGVDVVETPADQTSQDVLRTYLALKRRNRV